MQDNGKIAMTMLVTAYPSNPPGRHTFGLSPELGITTTTNENGQTIIEGSNESLTCLAEIILERCK
jgi:hypothetical protein